MSDTTADIRLDRLEATLARLEPMIVRIDEQLRSTLPHLSTRAELANLRAELKTDIANVTIALAEKPSKAFVVGLIALLTALYALGLASLAALPILRALVHP